MPSPKTKIRIENLSVSYKENRVLSHIHLDIPEKAVTAITGPSGVGKSTLLLALNRLLETEHEARISGKITLFTQNAWQDIHHPHTDVFALRQKISMVFQKPNPLPMGIFANLALPLKLRGIRKKKDVEEAVTQALMQARLWEEVRHRLKEDARTLSGGQQQRLCIARSLVMQPEVLLLDEPTSSLDTKAETAIENLLQELKKTCTLVLVSHSRRQVAYLADFEYAMPNV